MSKFRRLVGSHQFEWFIMFVIVLNTITMAAEYDDQPIIMTNTFQVTEYVFVVIFLAELVLKLLAFGPKVYFSQLSNVFDAFIVVLTTAAITPLDSSGQLNNVSVLRTFRILRLVRVLRVLRLVHKVLPISRIHFTRLEPLLSLHLHFLPAQAVVHTATVVTARQVVGSPADDASIRSDCDQPLASHFYVPIARSCSGQVLDGRANWVSPLLLFLRSTGVAVVLTSIAVVVQH